MDLKNIWQQGEHKDDMLHDLIQKQDFEHFHSNLPLKKLKRNLLTGNAWALLITAAYIVTLLFIPFWQVYVALIVLIIFNTWIMMETWKLYKKIPSTITPGNSLKQELTDNYTSFQKWWSIQLKVSMFVYPVATTGGFIIGGILGSGKSAADFLYNAPMLGILGITIIILMPLSYYAARWMFNYAYGKHLKKIKSLIDELN